MLESLILFPRLFLRTSFETWIRWMEMDAHTVAEPCVWSVRLDLNGEVNG